MRKMMFVTVGTSLFHSATWEPGPEVLRIAPGYSDWLTTEALGSPEARQRGERAARTRAGLMDHLAVDNVSEWAARLADDLLKASPEGPAMRYSAELATLVKMHEESGESPTFGDFLRGYERIHLLFEKDHDASGRPNDSCVAGNHLVGYLNRLAGRAVAAGLPISGLSSTDPARLIGGGGAYGRGALQRLAEELEKVRRPEAGLTLVDLVISGGYKLYGVALARLAEESDREPRFRLVYVHEMGERLMTYERGSIVMARHRVANPVPRISDRRPPA